MKLLRRLLLAVGLAAIIGLIVLAVALIVAMWLLDPVRMTAIVLVGGLLVGSMSYALNWLLSEHVK